jgi:hypothetical protein
MRVIWKYRLEFKETNIVSMQAGVVRRVAMQEGRPHLWAEVDPNVPARDRVFHIYATGQPIVDGDVYVTTFTAEDQHGFAYVWHVYERTN